MNSPLQRTMDDEEQQVCVDILSGNEDLGRAEDFVSVDDEEEMNIKEKRKTANSSAKKPPRPPQTQRAFSLDAADQKLIRELAMLKRARIERMRGLILQKKASKASSSSSTSPSSLFAMIFTIIVFVVLLFQGMSCQISCGTFQGSPPPLEANETGFIFIREELNLSAHDSV